jgi:hypothetical protein
MVELEKQRNAAEFERKEKERAEQARKPPNFTRCLYGSVIPALLIVGLGYLFGAPFIGIWPALLLFVLAWADYTEKKTKWEQNRNAEITTKIDSLISRRSPPKQRQFRVWCPVEEKTE